MVVVRVRSHFVFLVAVTLLPVLLLVGTIVFLVQREQRRSIERGLQEKAHALAVAVDRELESSLTALNSLAAAPTLDAPDLPAFYEHARRARDANRRWLTVYLVEASGHQLMTLLRPLGTPLPNVATVEFVRAVRDTGRPFVSNLEFGVLSQRHVIHINVPVVRDGRVRYILGASVLPDALTDVLTAQMSTPGSLGAIRDRRDVLVARSQDHGRHIGSAAEVDLQEKIRVARTRDDKVFEMRSLEGRAMLVAGQRVPTSDFTVLVGVPIAAIAAGSHRLWLLLSLGGSGVILGALAVSAILSRRIVRPIMALSRAATELANGEPISASRPSSVDEVAAVREAMVRGAEAFRERAAERDRRIAAETARAEAEHRAETVERMSREKDEFLAMLGHELRNPLGAIASANSVLSRVGNAGPPAERARAVIGRQVQHLVDVLDDLLDVSRVTMGKIVLTRRPVDLAGIVRRCLDNLETDGRTRAHDVSFEGRSVWVDGDETRLEQIASNVITNALKYTPNGGRVRVSVGPEDGEAVLRVQDTGIGIPAERVPQIFELFFQGERSLDRSQGGLGIGLTLVKRLTELHGGRVSAMSGGPNKGSTFTIQLPAIEAVGSTDGPPRGGRAAAYRIVIIEDNPEAREMLRTALELAGHVVWDVEDGSQGIETVRVRQPDAVVVDIGLPGLDGYEVGRRLRDLPDGRTLTLIALSGYGQPEDRRRSDEAGYDAHFVKPIDPDDLIQFIESADPERSADGRPGRSRPADAAQDGLMAKKTTSGGSR